MSNLIVFFVLIATYTFAQTVPDYNNPSVPIIFSKPVYSWTDKVSIKIIAPSWNTDNHLIDSIGGDEHNPIKVSTQGYELEPYRLTETASNSGIFVGEVILTGFPHDVDGDGNSDTTPRTTGNGPTSGFLETESNSAVTVSFEFADGVVITESAPIKWHQGTVTFSDKSYEIGESIIIRVVDLDMNLNPEALDHVEIEISSDSDAAGITVQAIETAEASGMFETVILLEPNLASSGNRLFAVPNDLLYAKYQDYTLPKPNSISDNLSVETTAKVSSVSSSEGSITKLINSEIIITDSFGSLLEAYSLNNQMQIVGVVTNEQAFNQDFIYFFKIENEEDTVDSISWVQGEIAANRTMRVSQSWKPQEFGEYTITTYIWKSLTEPTPIANPLSIPLSIQ